MGKAESLVSAEPPRTLTQFHPGVQAPNISLCARLSPSVQICHSNSKGEGGHSEITALFSTRAGNSDGSIFSAENKQMPLLTQVFLGAASENPPS